MPMTNVFLSCGFFAYPFYREIYFNKGFRGHRSDSFELFVSRSSDVWRLCGAFMASLASLWRLKTYSVPLPVTPICSNSFIETNCDKLRVAVLSEVLQTSWYS